jgi:hypothetical protein
LILEGPAAHAAFSKGAAEAAGLPPWGIPGISSLDIPFAINMFPGISTLRRIVKMPTNDF